MTRLEIIETIAAYKKRKREEKRKILRKAQANKQILGVFASAYNSVIKNRLKPNRW
jgi:hypothetical protein